MTVLFCVRVCTCSSTQKYTIENKSSSLPAHPRLYPRMHCATSRPSKRARALSESAPAQEISSLFNDLNAKVHTIIWSKWANKIISLSTFIKEKQNETFKKAELDVGMSTKAEMEAKQFSIHPDIKKIISKVKDEVIDLVGDLSLMITWVRLMRPKLEDGGNFGVAVQQDILSNLISGRGSAVAVYQSVCQYYYVRGRMLRRLKRAPHCADYLASLHSCDAKQFSESVQILSDLRSIYLMLSDKINKNYDNLSKPKGGISDKESRDLYC